jgi:hypothetical protein
MVMRMNVMLRRAFLLAASVITVACTSAPTPTRPSMVAWPVHGAQVVAWSTLTTSAPLLATPTTVPDAPGPPGQLAFTLSGNTVILTWSAPTLGAPTSYLVEAGSASGASNLAQFNTGSALATLTVTNVPAGTYFVRIRAVNADGAGPPSNEIIVGVGSGGPSPPGPAPGPTPCVPAPTGLAAGVSGNLLSLSWTGVGTAIAYIIEAGTVSGASDLANLDTGSTATTFSATVPNGTYFVRVRARAACGASSVSNEVTVIVTGAPGPPTATGRWAGLSPNGMFADSGQIHCPIELDLTMDLTSVGAVVTGSATTRTRVVQFASCSDVLGFVATYGVSGTIAADGTLALQFGTGDPAYTVTGAISSNTMSGRWTHASGQRGRFTVTRQ